MTPAPLTVVATGPVIPNFAAQSSSCEIHNRLFCTGWISRNWGPVLWPALRQHIVLALVAVAIGFVIAPKERLRRLRGAVGAQARRFRGRNIWRALPWPMPRPCRS